MTQRSETKKTTERSARRSRKTIRLGALLFVFALVAAACGGATTETAGQDESQTADGSQTEVPAGDNFNEQVSFSYETVDGEIVEFADLAPGQPVVLNFFASWCATCVAELPDFETVSQNFADDVQFFGLSVQDGPALSAELIERTGITFPTGVDLPGEIFLGFGGLGMPTTVFINADGSVADVHTGVLTVDSLTDAINEDLL